MGYRLMRECPGGNGKHMLCTHKYVNMCKKREKEIDG